MDDTGLTALTAGAAALSAATSTTTTLFLAAAAQVYLRELKVASRFSNRLTLLQLALERSLIP